jgi:hypothetical protein
VLTEVATKLNAADSRVCGREPYYGLPGVVAAAIFHHDDLKARGHAFQYSHESAIELIQAVLSLEHRDDNRKLRCGQELSSQFALSH